MYAATRVRSTVAVGGLIAALALSGCGGDSGSSGSGSGDDPILIGVSLPLTGDFSEPGQGRQ
jgi:branched-chain amino acid transport system substrate-binding protein